MAKARFCSLLVLAAALAAPAAARPAGSTGAATTSTETRALLDRVADWQLAHLGDFSYLSPVGRTADPRGWIQGVFWLGLSRLAAQPGEARYGTIIDRLGDQQAWRIGDRIAVADDQLIGRTWLARFEAKRDPRMIAPLRDAFDRILADPPRTPLTWGPLDDKGKLACLQRWCWADALFMAPATWAELSRVTGDPRYAAYAGSELRATIAFLYDPGERLFFRDSRFVMLRGVGGAKIFWSRGNGWVLAGLAETLRALPSDSPDRTVLIAIFKQMAGRIAQLQRPDGSWPSSLLEPGQPSTPETSGAALFVYAMAWGTNAGILDRAHFDRPIRKGWTRLTRAVADDGRVGWVQPIGDAPHTPQASDTQLYGSGAMLLAGTEILKLYAGTASSAR